MKPYFSAPGIELHHGDAAQVLRELPPSCVQCVVTSPPYWGLRDYGIDGQIGLEPTIDGYIERMVGVFDEVRRVLRDDGTLWLNMGDGYNANKGLGFNGQGGLKPKDLVGMPWRVAFALQADGWYLRSEIIWHKPNPMPESCTDRPTRSHEHMFLLTKRPRYYYDADAVRVEELVPGASARAIEYQKRNHITERVKGPGVNHSLVWDGDGSSYRGGANLRDVWKIPTYGYPGAHFATFPPKLVEPCILAGTSEKGACPVCGTPWGRVVESDRQPTRPGKNNCHDETGMANRDELRHVTTYTTTGWAQSCDCEPADPVPCVVLDPFLGSGTTGAVAQDNGCKFIGIELSEQYIMMASKRFTQQVMFHCSA